MAEQHRLHRGDVWDAELPDDIGRHSVVLLSRDAAIARRQRSVVALITSHIHGTRTEVPVGPPEGLDYDSVLAADDLYTITTGRLVGNRRGVLGSDKLAEVEAALRVALGLHG
jgi:mRNA-degrading endonuclease toxin of MazEF toxin-antitoxin module